MLRLGNKKEPCDRMRFCQPQQSPQICFPWFHLNSAGILSRIIPTPTFYLSIGRNNHFKRSAELIPSYTSETSLEREPRSLAAIDFFP